MAAGKYETRQPATWDEGDWNEDGLFTFIDILAALVTDKFENGPYAAVGGGAVRAKSEFDVHGDVSRSLRVAVPFGRELGLELAATASLAQHTHKLVQTNATQMDDDVERHRVQYLRLSEPGSLYSHHPRRIDPQVVDLLLERNVMDPLAES